jgi:hypothetical protein
LSSCAARAGVRTLLPRPLLPLPHLPPFLAPPSVCECAASSAHRRPLPAGESGKVDPCIAMEGYGSRLGQELLRRNPQLDGDGIKKERQKGTSPRWKTKTLRGVSWRGAGAGHGGDGRGGGAGCGGRGGGRLRPRCGAGGPRPRRLPGAGPLLPRGEGGRSPAGARPSVGGCPGPAHLLPSSHGASEAKRGFAEREAGAGASVAVGSAGGVWLLWVGQESGLRHVCLPRPLRCAGSESVGCGLAGGICGRASIVGGAGWSSRP